MIVPSQDKEKSFCALTAELVTVNRVKIEELLGRILSSLISRPHSHLYCTLVHAQYFLVGLVIHQSNYLKDAKN